jgi:hypothetical protein
MKDQKVEIDPKSKEEKDFTSDGIKWSRISWHGKNDEFGPADVGFLMTKAGNRVLAITFWITEKDKEKHAAELEKIFNSVSVRE